MKCVRYLIVSFSVLYVLACGSVVAPLSTPRISKISSREIKLQVLLADGKNLLSASRYDDAFLKYLSAETLFPDLEQIQLGKARALAGLNEFESSLSIFDKIIPNSKSSRALRSERAKVLITSGRLDQGINELTSLIAESILTKDISTIPEYRRNLADAYFEAGYEGEALCLSRLAYNDLADSKDEMLRHVNVSLATLQFNEALWSFKDFTARKGVQSDSSFFTLRSMSHRSLGHIEDSLLDARTALQFEQSIGSSQEVARFLIAVISKELFPNTFIHDDAYDASVERVRRSSFFWLAIPPRLLDDI